MLLKFSLFSPCVRVLRAIEFSIVLPMEKLALCCKDLIDDEMLTISKRFYECQNDAIFSMLNMFLGNILEDLNDDLISCECSRCMDYDTGLLDDVEITNIIVYREHNNINQPNNTCKVLKYIRTLCQQYHVPMPPMDYVGSLELVLVEGSWMDELKHLSHHNVKNQLVEMVNHMVKDIGCPSFHEYVFQISGMNVESLKSTGNMAIEPPRKISPACCLDSRVVQVLFDHDKLWKHDMISKV